MSSQLKFKEYSNPEENIEESRVNVSKLVLRLNQEKKKERQSNIVISIAAVSAISVFGIILSL
tara:strand:+ start:127 stop:315 length:189 start_codon:yes stop_codon:yes gene_type:complete